MASWVGCAPGRDARRGAWRAAGLVAALAAAWPTALAADEQKLARTAHRRGVAFLEQAQLPTGEFRMWACTDEALKDCAMENEALITATIAQGLAVLPGGRAEKVAQQAANFLMSQMAADGFFRYHLKEHPLSLEQPPTLEDTVVNLMMLEALGREVPDVTAVLKTYQTIGGSFHLFAFPLADLQGLRTDPAVREQLSLRVNPAFVELLDQTEPVANANIQAYLASHGQASEPLCTYLVGVAQQGLPPGYSMFYGSPYAFLYAASRAWGRGATCLKPALSEFERRLLADQHADGSWGSVLNTAWAGSALLWLNHRSASLERAVAWLAGQQREDGSWAREVAWSLARPPLWFGSEELTTGLAVELLARYLMLREAER